MAFGGNFMATSFKVELLQSYHNFSIVNPARAAANTADVFKLALYDNTPTFNASTTVYTNTGEVGNSGSYSAGGGALNTSIAGVATPPTSTSTTAYLSFADLSFTTATINSYGALIYNSSQGNRVVEVLDFGGLKSSVSGTFTIQFPTANSTSAILRIA